MKAQNLRAITALISALLIQQNALAKSTICTISINSTDEKKTFEKHLDSKAFEFIELTPPELSRKNFRSWFRDACAKATAMQTSCDALIISGHFVGDFFGASGFYLPLEDLEAESCAQTCNGVLKDPKAVFLFGCNTLATKAKDSRNGQSYYEMLVEDGFEPSLAEAFSESRYGPTGQMNSKRMLNVFSNSSRIYGFDSVGPLGSHVSKMIDNYFVKNPDFANLLQSLEAERSAKSMSSLLSQFEKQNNNIQDAFRCSLKDTNITCGNGICQKDAAIQSSVCMTRDKSKPLEQRLTALKTLLDGKDALAFVPTAQSLLAELDEAALSDPIKRKIKELRDNPRLKAALLTLIRKPYQFDRQKMKWISVARRLSWLNEAETNAECWKISKRLLSESTDLRKIESFFKLNIEFSEFRKSNFQFPASHKGMLMKLLKSPEPEWRSTALRALAEVGPDMAKTQALISSFYKDPAPEVRSQVIELLPGFRSSGTERKTLVATATHDPDPRVRRTAVAVMGRTGMSQTEQVTKLLGLINDSDTGVRVASIRVLTETVPVTPEIQARMLDALKDISPDVRYYAIVSLGAASSVDERVQSLIADRLGDNNVAVQVQAADSLGRMKTVTPKAIAALAKNLDNGDIDVRSAAYHALEQIKPADPQIQELMSKVSNRVK